MTGAVVGLLMLVHARNAGLVLAFSILGGRAAWRTGMRAAAAFTLGLAALLAVRTAINYYFWGALVTTPHAALGALPPSGMGREAATRLAGMLVDQEFGLLIYAPVYLLALFGLAVMPDRTTARRVMFVSACYLVPILLPLTNVHGWTGGWSPAARFLTPIAPLLALPLPWTSVARHARFSRWCWRCNSRLMGTCGRTRKTCGTTAMAPPRCANEAGWRFVRICRRLCGADVNSQLPTPNSQLPSRSVRHSWVKFVSTSKVAASFTQMLPADRLGSWRLGVDLIDNLLMRFALISLLLLIPSTLSAQLLQGVTYDPSIPTLESVVGHKPGEGITTPDQIGRYLEALAKAAPDRTRLVKYATTWEGRPLHYLIVGARERIARLDDIRRGMQSLAAAAPDADQAIAGLPVIVWLIHGVHGNEISSSDAALQEAYHLLAARGDANADATVRDALVIIDPMQNPDGRQRFVTSNLLGRSAEPDAEPLSVEHDEPWPGGRSNHYLFDMNRDYFALSQPETQGRARVMLEWYPQVVVDLHEMGGNSTYYFAPPADPINPYTTDAQRRWLDTFGRANAAEFDRRGFGYFVREVYDAFYPGYGDSWPMFHGAVAMTFEQASARGLRFRRHDQTTLTYKDAVTHHFTAAITTAVTAAKHRERLLRDFLEYRRSAVKLGQQGTREYLISAASDPSRAARLAEILTQQGIQVKRAEEPFEAGTRTLPAGTFIVPLAQPSGRLVRNLLDPDIKMDEAFLKEQDRRRKERLPDQIYDVTAWSLPLAFDVDIVSSDRTSTVRSQDVVIPPAAASSARAAADPGIAQGTIGFLMPWGSGAAATAAEALRAGIRMVSADEAFMHAKRSYPAGTAFIRLADNAQNAAATLRTIAARHNAELVPISETWTDSGISLGSGRVASVKAPRVLLAWDAPVSSLSAGWARFMLERRFGQRVTAMRTSTLQNFNMSEYDVLVLPSGTYAFSEDGLRRLRDWIRNGGTLITLAEASRWAARDRVGLLSTDTLLRDGTAERDPDATPGGQQGQGSGSSGAKPDTSKPFDYDKAIQPERERPENLAGAMLRVRLDRSHWLTAGLDNEITAVVEGARVFAPIKLDAGRNVGVYQTEDRLVAAGLVWKEAQPLLAQRAFLMHQPIGSGHIIAFAEDPNYRAFTEATELLFINAVLLGPAH